MKCWLFSAFLYVMWLQVLRVEGFNASTCDETSPCMSIFECDAYKNADVVHIERPQPCGFSGTTPLVCCPLLPLPPTVDPPITVSTPRPPSTTVQPQISEKLQRLLPADCGDSSRFLFTKPVMAPSTRPGCDPNSDEWNPEDCPPGVIGGHAATLGRWPWMVLFGKWLPTKDVQLGDWFCGGTLITDRHVLTAAHCLRPEQAGAVGARLGDYDLSITNDVDHQDRIVTAITRHEQYRGAQNDIAIAELDRPYDASETIRPICLPTPGVDVTGSDVELAGWGRLEFGGDVPDVLQEAALVVSDERECENAYSQIQSFASRFQGGFQGTKICALSRDGEPRDACRGDSGGPLMAVRPNSNLYELIGVVSTGAGCGNPKYPGIYTKVSAYIEWILKHIG